MVPLTCIATTLSSLAGPNAQCTKPPRFQVCRNMRSSCLRAHVTECISMTAFRKSLRMEHRGSVETVRWLLPTLVYAAQEEVTAWSVVPWPAGAALVRSSKKGPETTRVGQVRRSSPWAGPRGSKRFRLLLRLTSYK